MLFIVMAMLRMRELIAVLSQEARQKTEDDGQDNHQVHGVLIVQFEGEGTHAGGSLKIGLG